MAPNDANVKLAMSMQSMPLPQGASLYAQEINPLMEYYQPKAACLMDEFRTIKNDNPPVVNTESLWVCQKGGANVMLANNHTEKSGK